MVEQDIN